MLKEKMTLVASSEDVNIYCPEGGKFSFFNSPYHAHQSYTGIDIYPSGTFDGIAPSPVLGKVIKIRPVRCPEGKGFETSQHDYVILLRSLENLERYVKILHVKPFIKVGDIVEPCQDLGILLKSGYFDFWTEPHLHVEVRKPSDPIRARGGFKLERLMKISPPKTMEGELIGNVVESKPEYSLIAVDDSLHHGIPVDLNGQAGLLDAGIPHYGQIGVHTNSIPAIGDRIRLWGKEIGSVKSAYSNMCIAECRNLVFMLNKKPIQLSSCLHLSSIPLLKIIPHRLGKITLEKSERISIVISQNSIS